LTTAPKKKETNWFDSIVKFFKHLF